MPITIYERGVSTIDLNATIQTIGPTGPHVGRSERDTRVAVGISGTAKERQITVRLTHIVLHPVGNREVGAGTEIQIRGFAQGHIVDRGDGVGCAVEQRTAELARDEARGPDRGSGVAATRGVSIITVKLQVHDQPVCHVDKCGSRRDNGERRSRAVRRSCPVRGAEVIRRSIGTGAAQIECCAGRTGDNRPVLIPLIGNRNGTIGGGSESDSGGGILHNFLGARNCEPERRSGHREKCLGVMVLHLRQGQSVGVNEHLVDLSVEQVSDRCPIQCPNQERSRSVALEVDITDTVPLTVDINLEGRIVDHHDVFPLASDDAISRGR